MSMFEVIIWGIFGVIFGAALVCRRVLWFILCIKSERQGQININNKDSNATHYEIEEIQPSKIVFIYNTNL